MYNKIMQKWFIDVWEEDISMRDRRLKVWKLGFEDFKGVDYINDPKIIKNKNSNREYKVSLPIPKITHIKNKSSEKTFLRIINKSKHIGYGLPDL